MLVLTDASTFWELMLVATISAKDESSMTRPRSFNTLDGVKRAIPKSESLPSLQYSSERD